MGRFPTRKLILLLALCALASHSQAQASEDFPTRPIRMLVGFSAGGATDVQARLVAQLLSDRLGQTVIIENRPGAGGSIASGAVAKAQPDGYTLLYTSAALAINSALYSKLPFDPVADFAPIGTTTKTLNALVVHPSVPARTTADFIKYVKASPGTVSMGSPGIGSSGHMAQVQFNTMAGIVVNQVPYKGTNDVVRDIVSGQIKATVDAATVYLPYLKDGALLALCVGDTTRAALLPNVPTCDESGLSGYSVRSWQGILAPARTPKPIVEKLGRELAEVLKNPGLIQKLQASGARVLASSPDEFATLVRQDVKAFDELVKAAGIEKQ
ncbi:Bug family tripartite tricarboxylate transporter substrate binding protein [Ottowia thiooxydans]|uniref:Tripartite-type tricarboxylate transporter receptor subunit TctC n=1 Tax=Ottowia thiooxydans TaxID=219182 RepID=A0ABV2QFT4_9BURK